MVLSLGFHQPALEISPGLEMMGFALLLMLLQHSARRSLLDFSFFQEWLPLQPLALALLPPLLWETGAQMEPSKYICCSGWIFALSRSELMEFPFRIAIGETRVRSYRRLLLVVSLFDKTEDSTDDRLSYSIECCLESVFFSVFRNRVMVPQVIMNLE